MKIKAGADVKLITAYSESLQAVIALLKHALAKTFELVLSNTWLNTSMIMSSNGCRQSQHTSPCTFVAAYLHAPCQFVQVCGFIVSSS